MDTRTQILEKNYESMCLHGFQGLRTDKVIGEMGITKGAFYHYFSSKKELGYAIVDEIVTPQYINNFLKLRSVEKNIIQHIQDILKIIQSYTTAETVSIGCPLNNLIQEMSPLDEKFRIKLSNVLETQKNLLVTALEKGVANGELKDNVVVNEVAVYILASIEGSHSIGKSFQSKAIFDQAFNQISKYLDMLKKEN